MDVINIRRSLIPPFETVGMFSKGTAGWRATIYTRLTQRIGKPSAQVRGLNNKRQSKRNGLANQQLMFDRKFFRHLTEHFHIDLAHPPMFTKLFKLNSRNSRMHFQRPNVVAK